MYLNAFTNRFVAKEAYPLRSV